MKKLNLLFTALLLMCCVGNAKAEKVTIDGIKYDVITKAKQATVISGGNYSGDIVIPSEITYNNVIYSVTSIGIQAFRDYYTLTSITIPNSVTSIESWAFRGCTSLTSVVIGNSVTSIGERAFEGCSGLTSITIPNSVTSIEEEAFWGCSGLTSITIPNSVTSIGYGAFYGCSGLTSITIPNSVTSIEYGAFGYCSGLESIVVDPGNTKYDSRENCNAIIETESNTLIAGCKNTIISNSVTSIRYRAFMNCGDLTNITIPNSVTSIEEEAFAGCSGLTNVTIPNSVTSIGEWAFAWCSGLESIVVDPGNTKYDSRENCNAIIETESNTLIAGCKNTVIPNSVTSIRNMAFISCFDLTNITIPNSVTSIEKEAFAGCSGLTSITIPNSVASIGDDAFWGCLGLTSITIGNGVTSIGEKAFYNCENLADVYCLATDVPTTNSDAFYGLYPKNMTLHVPAEAINSYKTTAPWSSFGNIVTLDGEIVEPEEPEVKICSTPVISYYNRELVIECETENAEFVTKITSSDFNSFYSNSIALTATYNISVYATAAGYDNSDTVNATLCWIECDCDADDNTDIINIPAKAVFVTSNNGTINISCALEGENVAVYSSNAMYIGSTTIENGCASIQSGLSKGDIAIIKIAEKSIKVILN